MNGASSLSTVLGIEVLFGEGILEQETGRLPRSYAVVTTASPWKIVGPDLHHAPSCTLMVPNLEMTTIEGLLATCGPVDAFVGVGAGMTMDAAKYMAWKRGVRLFQIPTTTSSNTPFTRSAGIRNAPVRPAGDILADAVIVDYTVIRRAPRRLNVAGAADILAIHTGTWDWRLAAHRGTGAPWDPTQAAQAMGWVQQIREAYRSIVSLSNEGIRLLMELFAEMGGIFNRNRHSYGLAGAEHWWTQNVEWMTGRHFLHGEILSLGLLAISWIQRNDPEGIRELIVDLGIEHAPAALGITAEEVRQAFETYADFLVGRSNLHYSCLNEFRLSQEAWAGLCCWLGLEEGDQA